MKQSGSCIRFIPGWEDKQSRRCMQAIFEKHNVDEAKQNIEFNHGTVINVPLTLASDYPHLNCILHAAIHE